MSLLASLVRRHGPRYPVGWRRSSHDVQGVSRARLRVQSSRKVGVRPLYTDGACFSTTALLSGRDRPLRLCVLRPRGSEPETRRTGVWRPLSQASASSWRALASGVRPLSATNRCRVHTSANARPRIRTFSVPYVVHAWPEVRRWSTYLAGSSSSWELRAGRTGPTVIALPRLQTALKIDAQTRPRLSKLKLRPQPVGPQRNKDDRREYVRGGK